MNGYIRGVLGCDFKTISKGDVELCSSIGVEVGEQLGEYRRNNDALYGIEAKVDINEKVYLKGQKYQANYKDNMGFYLMIFCLNGTISQKHVLDIISIN